MLKWKLLAILGFLVGTAGAAWGLAQSGQDRRVYELRFTYASAGKMDALVTRFRDHSKRLFEKNGMTPMGFWTVASPSNDADRNLLVYLLAFPSVQAQEKAWKAFMADPEWQQAFKESEKNGRLTEKGDTRTLLPTDFSPLK
jgi:NIPSNAP